MPQQFYPVIPQIAQAYENDPRTKLAQAALAQGTSTAPVAGGKWAWASGLARVGNSIVGAIENKQQQRKYNDKQQQVMDEVASALGNGGAAGPQGGGGTGPAAGGTPPQPPASAPVPPVAQNNLPPQAPPQAPPAPPMAPPQGGPPPAPQGAPAAPQGGFDGLGRGAPSAPVPGRTYNVADAVAELGMDPAAAQAKYGHVAAALSGQGGAAPSAAPFPPSPTQGGVQLINAMLPITRSTESNGQDFNKNGSVVTSIKGARYAMQVMPATARDPGFGITPARDSSPQEYNRVGTELLQKLTEKYGDPAKAWAAYNAGTGRVDHAIAKGGDGWLAVLPTETQNYVKKNMDALGGPQGGGTQQAAADEYQIPGADPLLPTQAPPIPGLPNAPQDRGAAQSLSLAGAQKLLATKDPFLYQQAMAMLDKGQGEQFGANQKALDVLNNRDNYGYQQGVDDHYNALQAQRNDAYATGRELRGYAHENNLTREQQAFKKSEDGTHDVWQAGQNALERQNNLDVANINAKGKTDAASIRAQRMQQFFQTPQGAKLYGEAQSEIGNNNSLAGLVDNFMQENGQYQDTGGMVLNNGWGAGISRTLNGHLQTMDSITHQLAPMIRQKGQGSMSDRDLEMFERAIPSIGNNYDTNVKRAAQFKQYVSRMNDYQTHMLEAAANGENVNFLKSWEAYRNSVPVSSGKSYDDWVASIPHYDAQGNKK